MSDERISEDELDAVPVALATEPRTERYGIVRGLKPRSFRARELGISESTLARAMRRRELGYTRIGDRPLISDAHLEAWLAQREVPAKARGTNRGPATA